MRKNRRRLDVLSWEKLFAKRGFDIMHERLSYFSYCQTKDFMRGKQVYFDNTEL